MECGWLITETKKRYQEGRRNLPCIRSISNTEIVSNTYVSVFFFTGIASNSNTKFHARQPSRDKPWPQPPPPGTCMPWLPSRNPNNRKPQQTIEETQSSLVWLGSRGWGGGIEIPRSPLPLPTSDRSTERCERKKRLPVDLGFPFQLI